MATFPRTEPQIVALAQEMVTGLTANVAIYADPPVTPASLTTKVTAYTAARNAVVAAQAPAEQATATKDDALAALADDMNRDNDLPAICIYRCHLPDGPVPSGATAMHHRLWVA